MTSVPVILGFVASIAHTVRIDHLPGDQRIGLDPFVVGSLSGLLWKGNDRTLAGFGPVRRLALTRPGGFAAVQARLADLGSDTSPGDPAAMSPPADIPGTGPVAFASLDFDPDQDGELLVPRFVICANPNGHRWLTMVESDDGAPGGTLGPGSDAASVVRLAQQAVDELEAARSSDPEPTEMTLRSSLAPEYWRDRIVGSVRDMIRCGDLDKCVLARELVVTADSPFDPATVVTRLGRTFPTANVFLVDGFIGASPELLVARLGDLVRAHPLAGTLPRSTDPDRDRTLAAELLASDKNRWEHQITIDWLLDNLLPFCSYVDAEPEPSIVSLANVHHLGTRVEGRLSSPPASVLELVDALHPTPAVGGDPQKAAIDLIADMEQAQRDRYGGPTGWVDGNGNGEFAVSVRCAQFEAPDRVRLFAGVGVVGDSDLQAELDETRAKFQAILGALIQP